MQLEHNADESRRSINSMQLKCAREPVLKAASLSEINQPAINRKCFAERMNN